MARKASWAALVWLVAAPAAYAADELSRETPASPQVTPLDLSPTPAAHTDFDTQPTGTTRPTQTAGTAVSPLDFSTTGGFRAELPPEAPAPTLSTPASIDDESKEGARIGPAPSLGRTSPAPMKAHSDEAQENPKSEETRAPAVAVAVPDVLSPSPTPSPALGPPRSGGDQDATPASPPRDAAAAVSELVHSALDQFLAAPAAGKPVGAGDWAAAKRAVAAVYLERNFAPFWIEQGAWTFRAMEVLDRLSKADEDGLELSGTPLPDLRSQSDPETQARAEVALSAAVVAYALQASGSRLYPRLLSKDVSAKPEVADPAYALKAVASAPDATAALSGFNPPQAGYRDLRAALAELRSEAARPVADFKAGPVLKIGMSDPRVPLIRARFRLSPIGDAASADVYDVRVASAVAAFQRVHGLQVSGALTEATATALDGVNLRSRQETAILANMEVWRWEPRDMGGLRVEVNVPDFSLRVMRDDTIIHRARVIVGKPDTPTPIFSNFIKYMLFNPVWHVPESIVKKEMAPKLAADPDYLARHGYKVKYAGDKMEVEQPPGEANALGRMLFLFPNEYSVYLHDTPLRALFGAPYRALSHGCVRVENPGRLAEIVMGGAERGWNSAKAQSLVGDKERTFSTPAPVPVHLEYFTAFVEDGVLQERQDVYGLTRKVSAALAALRRD